LNLTHDFPVSGFFAALRVFCREPVLRLLVSHVVFLGRESSDLQGIAVVRLPKSGQRLDVADHALLHHFHESGGEIIEDGLAHAADGIPAIRP
jgi:hypothetical protein